MIRKVLWTAFCAAALCWIAAMLHRGLELGWDEIEFFRASRWIAEGKLPYRDFWEHHPPLQWFLFAPVAALADGPGVASIVAMRWAQVVPWVATFWLMWIIRARLRATPTAGAAALALLLASPSFHRSAIEFRVDVPGNLAWFAAIALVLVPRPSRRTWIGVGALMSLAALANMRLAPLIVVTGLVLLFWRGDGESWGPNSSAPWMLAGVLPVATAFVGLLAAGSALEPFIDQVVRFNLLDSTRYGTFWVTVLNPIATGDIAAVVLWLLGIVGVVQSFRSFRQAGPGQLLSILFIASVATVAAMAVHYPYHLQQTYLVLYPLAAFAFTRLEQWERWRTAASIVVCFALVATLTLQAIRFAGPHLAEPLAYQNRVMVEVDRRTEPGDTVFDGCGYALRREPAYRFWFLTNPVRIAAARGLIEPYDAAQIAASPPAALIYNIRMQRWFEIHPRLAAWAVNHYVPVYRELWVPGLTGRIRGRGRATWRVPADGTYEIFASAALARHPWFTRPLDYAAMQGPLAAGMVIPLRTLPSIREGLVWKVDGRVVDPNRRLTLRKGTRVELTSNLEHDAGVVVVPEGTDVICMAPEEVFVF